LACQEVEALKDVEEFKGEVGKGRVGVDKGQGGWSETIGFGYDGRENLCTAGIFLDKCRQK